MAASNKKVLIAIAAGAALYFGYRWYKDQQVKKQVSALLNHPLVLRSVGNVPAPGQNAKNASYGSSSFDWTKSPV